MSERRVFRLRSKARQTALQALYAWLMADSPLAELEDFFTERQPLQFDLDYFQRLLYGVGEHCADLDALYLPFIEQKRLSLDPVEQTVLRIAVFELLYSVDVPEAVVLDEAIELGKLFGAADSYKFVNSVLDRLVKQRSKASQ